MLFFYWLVITCGENKKMTIVKRMHYNLRNVAKFEKILTIKEYLGMEIRNLEEQGYPLISGINIEGENLFSGPPWTNICGRGNYIYQKKEGKPLLTFTRYPYLDIEAIIHRMEQLEEGENIRNDLSKKEVEKARDKAIVDIDLSNFSSNPLTCHFVDEKTEGDSKHYSELNDEELKLIDAVFGGEKILSDYFKFKDSSEVIISTLKKDIILELEEGEGLGGTATLGIHLSNGTTAQLLNFYEWYYIDLHDTQVNTTFFGVPQTQDLLEELKETIGIEGLQSLLKLQQEP